MSTAEAEFPQGPPTANSQRPTLTRRPPATLRQAACCKPASPLPKPASHSPAQKHNLVQRSSRTRNPGPRAPVGSNCWPVRKCYPDREKPKRGSKKIINPSKAMMFCQKQKNGPLPSPHCQHLIKPPPPPRLCPAAACLSTFLSGAIPPWPWKGVAPTEGAISDWPITLPST